MKFPTPVCLFSENDIDDDSVYVNFECANVLPSTTEEQDAQKREWEKKCSRAHKLATVRLHVNLRHPNGTTLAKMLSGAGASDELQLMSMRWEMRVAIGVSCTAWSTRQRVSI